MKIILVFLVIAILLYFLYKMRTYGGAYFDKTFDIKINPNLKKRNPNFREKSVDGLKFIKNKGYLSELKDINAKVPDLNYKLKLITNIFASSISYEDGMNLINTVKTSEGIEYSDSEYPEFKSVTQAIPNSSETMTNLQVLKNFDGVLEDIINNGYKSDIDARLMSYYLNDTLLNEPNPVNTELKKMLNVKDLRGIRSYKSYHDRESNEYNLCGLRAVAPGLYEQCVDDAINNQYKTRKCTEEICIDGIGIKPYHGYYNAFASEMHMNLIALGFAIIKEEIFIVLIYRKPLIKDAPFILINTMYGHAEPLYINFKYETSEESEKYNKKAYKVLNSFNSDTNKQLLKDNSIIANNPNDSTERDTAISNIATFIDNIHSRAGKHTLNTVYSQHTFDSIPSELSETQKKKYYDFNYELLTDKFSYEKEVLKKAYDLTKKRLGIK